MEENKRKGFEGLLDDLFGGAFAGYPGNLGRQTPFGPGSMPRGFHFDTESQDSFLSALMGFGRKNLAEELDGKDPDFVAIRIQYAGLKAARQAEYDQFMMLIERLQEQLKKRDTELDEVKKEKSELGADYQQKVNVINRLSRDYQRANNEHDQSLGELIQQHKNIVDVLQGRNEKVEAENTRMKDRLLLLTATIGAAMAKIDMIVDAGNYNRECVLQIMDILKRAQLPADDPASTPTDTGAKPDEVENIDPEYLVVADADIEQPTDDAGI